MRARVLRDDVRGDGAQQVVRPRDRTIEQQQPRGLEVRYSAQLVPQLRLSCEAVLQEARRAVDAALEGLLLCRALANLARSTSPLSEVSPSAPFCFHFALKRW